MHHEVNELGQMNVEIDNVVANQQEVEALKTALAKVYHQIADLSFTPFGESKLGRK
jgi:hypothetical protein